MKHLAAAAILVIAAAEPPYAQQAVPAGAPARPAADVERLLRGPVRIAGQPDTAFVLADRMRYWNVPGVAIAVVEDFRVVWAKGFGTTEYGGGRPVDTTTLFQAGSISKPVFTSGVLRMVERGTLSLDEDVNAKLKSWKLPASRFTASEPVTLRRLLTHTAGLTVWGFPGYASTAEVPTVTQVLDGAKPANTGAVRNDTTPGARWRYSGGGFTIAQLLATDVAGVPFPALMRRLVLQPSGMSRSTYENPLPAARRAEASSGHERVNTPVPGRFHTYPEMAAAGLWTTAPDLARWAIALSRAYNGQATRGFLSPEMARQMVSRQVTLGPEFGGGHFGLGVAVEGDGDSIAFSHNGRDEGFAASMRIWPTLGRGYVILTNGVSGQLIAEITRSFAEVYGLGERPRPERVVVPVDAESLADYAGRFVTVQGRDTLRLDVTVDAGALWLHNQFNGRRMRLWAEAKDTFLEPNNGATWQFERDSTGVVRSLRLGRGANAPRAVKSTP